MQKSREASLRTIVITSLLSLMLFVGGFSILSLLGVTSHAVPVVFGVDDEQ